MKRRIKAKSFSIVAPIGFWDKPLTSFIFIALALVLLFLSTLNPSAFNGMRSATANAFSPVISLLNYPLQEATQFVRNVSGLSSLQAKNAALEQENARLREWYQTALTLQEQNQSLKELLNVKLEPQYKYTTARIIADLGSAFAKSLLIKAGEQDGVQKSQAVIAGDGLLGRVISVSNQTSRVLLVTDINSRVPVMIEGINQHAILAGKNANAPVLEHVPEDIKIPIGARIITSGKGGVFPAGLPVGQVSQIQGPNAQVQIFVDMNDVQYVRVVSEKDAFARVEQ